MRLGIPSLLSRSRIEVGCMGCPALRPGKSHRLPGLVAAVRFGRAARYSRTMASNGAGTGAGGSPTAISICPPWTVMSSILSRATLSNDCA